LDQGRVKTLLVVIVQQHRDDGGLVLALRQFPTQGFEALAALRVQLVAQAQLRFEEAGHALGDDLRHVFIGREGALLHFDAVALGDAVQLQTLDAGDEGDGHAGRAGPAGAAGPMDVGFGIFRRLELDDV
jgi:hypothetical protein